MTAAHCLDISAEDDVESDFVTAKDIKVYFGLTNQSNLSNAIEMKASKLIIVMNNTNF